MMHAFFGAVRSPPLLELINAYSTHNHTKILEAQMRRVQLLAFLLGIGALQCANAVIIEFDLTFDGTSVSVDSGSTIPAGTSLVGGDSFNLDLRAAGNDFWSVDASYSSSFPLSFFVLDPGIRTADVVSLFFLDDVQVASITETGVTQQTVHIGAQFWTLAAGLAFDTISMSYDLLTSTAPTTIQASPDIFNSFGSPDNPFFRSDLISYQTASVPEPSTLMLMGIGLAGLGWMGRRRQKI